MGFEFNILCEVTETLGVGPGWRKEVTGSFDLLGPFCFLASMSFLLPHRASPERGATWLQTLPP